MKHTADFVVSSHPGAWPSFTKHETEYFNEILDKFHTKRLSDVDLRAELVFEFSRKLGGGSISFHASATRAFACLIDAIGLTSGDEVILPVNTFYSLYSVLSKRGVSVVAVDTLPNSQKPDVDKLLERVNVRTKLIIFPHMGGIYSDVKPLMERLRPEIYVVRDLCQSYPFDECKMLKPYANLYSIFSFSRTKVLSAGEGGAVHTYSDVSLLRSYNTVSAGLENYRHDKTDKISYFQEATLLTRLRNDMAVLDARKLVFSEAAKPLTDGAQELFCESTAHIFDSLYSIPFTLRDNDSIKYAHELLHKWKIPVLSNNLLSMSLTGKALICEKFPNFESYSNRTLVNSLSTGNIRG